MTQCKIQLKADTKPEKPVMPPFRDQPEGTGIRI